MYLSAEKYVGNWNHSRDEEKERFKATLRVLGINESHVAEGSPGLTVSVNVAYWRKANAIHRWFVENVQDGVDECQRSYVAPELLESLRDKCKEALENLEMSSEIMPTKGGFFFGSTEYDEWYIEDLKDTVKQLDKVLAIDGTDFYYRASW